MGRQFENLQEGPICQLTNAGSQNRMNIRGLQSKMSVKVHIFYPHLQQFTHAQEVVNVNGDTVGKCLGHLVKQFPGIEQGIFDQQGQLLNYVYLFVNGKASYPTDLTMPVNDGDELTIALLLAGG